MQVHDSLKVVSQLDRVVKKAFDMIAFTGNGAEVEMIGSFKFLGINIANDLPRRHTDTSTFSGD